MNDIPVRITFKGYEEFGKVVAVPTAYDFCDSVYNSTFNCCFANSLSCPACRQGCGDICNDKVFVKYEGKW